MYRTPLIIYALLALLGAYLLYYGFTFHAGDAMFGAIHVRAAYCIPGIILVVVATTKLLRGLIEGGVGRANQLPGASATSAIVPSTDTQTARAAWWITSAALFCGCAAIIVQWVGLLVAIFTPYDNQGAVGKAFASIFTQFAAIPLALAAIALIVVARIVAGRFTYRLQLAIWCAVGGLIPLSMGYVALIR